MSRCSHGQCRLAAREDRFRLVAQVSSTEGYERPMSKLTMARVRVGLQREARNVSGLEPINSARILEGHLRHLKHPRHQSNHTATIRLTKCSGSLV